MALMSNRPCDNVLFILVVLAVILMTLSVGTSYNIRNKNVDRRGHNANSGTIAKSVSVTVPAIAGHYSTSMHTTISAESRQRELGTTLVPANTTSFLKQQPIKQIAADPFNTGFRMPFVFVHIPKTGGEAMEKILHVGKSHEALVRREKGDLCSPEKRNPKRVWCKPICACDAYLNEVEVKHWRSVIESGQHLPVFKISIVRNPFERALSWYYFCIHGYGFINRRLPWPHTVCQAARDFSFSEWVVKVFKTQEIKGGGRDAAWDMKWNQVQWLKGADGKIDWSTTFLIRNENRSETTAQAAKLIGVELSSKDIHLRRNPSRWPNGHDYHDYYDDQSREIIEKTFAEDLRVLNYTF